MASSLCLPPPEGGAVITDTLFMSDSRCLTMQSWPIHYANGMHRTPTPMKQCSTFWRIVGLKSRSSRAANDRCFLVFAKCASCFCRISLLCHHCDFIGRYFTLDCVLHTTAFCWLFVFFPLVERLPRGY